jgi:hypothetical protein
MGPAGWFVSLFFLPAVGIINLQWEALGTPLTVKFWAIKAACISLLVVASVALSRRRLPDRMTEKLLAVSRLGFLLLFFYLTLGVVRTAVSVWGGEHTASPPFASGDVNQLLIGLVAIVLGTVMMYRAARNRRHVMVLLLGLFLAGYFARRWELLRQTRGRTLRRLTLPDWLRFPRFDYLLPVAVGIATSLLFFFLQRDLGPALFVS